MSLENSLLTEAKAAEWLHVSVSVMRKWRKKSGVGPQYIRIGKMIRYSLSALEAWVSTRTEGAHVTALLRRDSDDSQVTGSSI